MPDSAKQNPLPTQALDALAARFRTSGLCLLTFNAEGSVEYFDRHAPTFYQRYAVAVLNYIEIGNQTLKEALTEVTASGEVAVRNLIPGTVMAAFAQVERKQSKRVIALLGRSAEFAIDSQTSELCHQLALDTDWLDQEAQKTPAFTPEAIGDEARRLSTMLVDQLRVSELEREVESLSGQLANTYEELSLIYRISGGMRVNRGAGEFFKQTCLDVLDIMGVRGMGVALRAESLPLHDPVVYGDTSLPPGAVRRVSDLLLDTLKTKKKALVINNLESDASFGWIAPNAQRLLAVPLQREEQILGTLFCFDKSAGEFDSVDAKLLTSIANESAIYLENAVLFEDVRGLMMGLLHSLVRAVDAKDAYTCGHSERVALVARELATVAGVPKQKIERTYMAGLLHDVGKIGVPEAVLQKPGKLTDEEFALMKQHPEIGARILKDVRQLEDIIPGVMHHHERFDGNGYPSKLAGEAIPLNARIICLADCFDAMTSNRTYRRALPFEVAMMEIRKGAGTHFDPVLAEAFIQIGEKRLRELTSGHHEQMSQLLQLDRQLRVA